VGGRGSFEQNKQPVNQTQVRGYESSGLEGMYGDGHDDGYSRTGLSCWAAVYQQRTKLTSMNIYMLPQLEK
jgi:hypothetical protein